MYSLCLLLHPLKQKIKIRITVKIYHKIHKLIHYQHTSSLDMYILSYKLAFSSLIKACTYIPTTDKQITKVILSLTQIMTLCLISAFIMYCLFSRCNQVNIFKCDMCHAAHTILFLC